MMKLRWFFGGFIIFMGILILLHNFNIVVLPWNQLWSWSWKLLLISLGVFLLGIPLLLILYNQLLHFIFGRLEEQHVPIDQEIVLDHKLDKIEINMHKSRLSILQHDEDKVYIKGVMKIWTNSMEKAIEKMEKAFKVQVVHNKLQVKQEKDHRYFLDFSQRNKITAELTIYIPKSVPLNTNILYGKAEVKNVDNEVTLQVTNGKVILQNIRRNVDVRATNTSIKAMDLEQGVKLQTVNGKIEGFSSKMGGPWSCSSVNGKVIVFIKDKINQNIKLDSVNGKISLLAEKEIDAQVEAKSVNGKVHSNFTWNRKERGFQQTILGAGKANINLSTVNGKIEVKQNEGSL